MKVPFRKLKVLWENVSKILRLVCAVDKYYFTATTWVADPEVEGEEKIAFPKVGKKIRKIDTFCRILEREKRKKKRRWYKKFFNFFLPMVLWTRPSQPVTSIGIIRCSTSFKRKNNSDRPNRPRNCDVIRILQKWKKKIFSLTSLVKSWNDVSQTSLIVENVDMSSYFDSPFLELKG